MIPADLARGVRARALSLGFDLVGVASAGGIDRDAAALDRWIDRGLHASMGWMARTRAERKSPASIVEDCRSVVCVALGYRPAAEEAGLPAGWGKVARYARGRDYHRVLGTRLRKLAAWIEEASSRPARAFADSAPVLERAWAERAGLGWIGKSSNLVTRTMGSWIVLGEILTAAEIEPSPGPHPDRCGSCAACLDACPTGAILEPGVVDAGRCVSYWTIEHRGGVAEDRRAGNGAWIFGCDECQTACPWNRRAATRASADPLAAREDLRGLDPVEVLGMDATAFRGRFSGTPLARAGRDGMRRNACLVLGCARGERGIAALRGALRDDDPVVRSHAAWALARIG